LLALWVPPASSSRQWAAEAADALSTANWFAGDLSRMCVDRRRAHRSCRRSRAARTVRSAIADERLAAGGGWRRPHACPGTPGVAGHVDGDPAAHSSRRMRLRALSQWRASPALAGTARDDLSATVAGGKR
jgi:hypothetical protein